MTASSWARPAIVPTRPKVALSSLAKCCDSTLPLRTRIPIRITPSPCDEGVWAYSTTFAVSSAWSCNGIAGSSAIAEDTGHDTATAMSRSAFDLVSDEAIGARAIRHYPDRPDVSGSVPCALERLGEIVRRVGAVEHAVDVAHDLRDLVAVGVGFDRVEGDGAELRVALGDRGDLAVDNILSALAGAIDRNDHDVRAGSLAQLAQGGDDAEGHRVAVRVDDVRGRVLRQQRLGEVVSHHLVEVAALRHQDGHAGLVGDLRVEALLALHARRRADGALELDDLGLAAGLVDQP